MFNRSLNKAMLIGRLGHSPRTSYTQGGIARCTFSLATDAPQKEPDGSWGKRTDWHRIVVWGKRAATCDKHLSRGALVYVEGPIQHREYTKGDQTRTITEVIASTVELLQRGQERSDAATTDVATTQQPDPPASAYEREDDIPF